MIKEFLKSISKKKDLSVNIFSESTLKTSFYEELQKNEWCNVINDKPDDLMELITFKIKRKKL